MHLQIVWAFEPGRVFFWVAQALGWAVSAILLSTEMSLSGVSFRFGDYCHVNHENSLETLWGPLLGFAGVSLLLQLTTFAYCLNVYLKHSMKHLADNTGSSRGKTSTLSSRSANARTVFRRVQKVLTLQWRGLAIAVVVVADVIFFSVVFVVLDSQTQRALREPQDFLPWLFCIALQGDKDQCIGLASKFSVNAGILIATLILLSVTGIEAFVLICRVGMFTGWMDLFKKLGNRRICKKEFVSIDAHRSPGGKPDYELLNVSSPRTPVTAPNSASLKAEPFVSPIQQSDFAQQQRWSDATRYYQYPTRSFSNPRPPSSHQQASAHQQNASTYSTTSPQSTIKEYV